MVATGGEKRLGSIWKNLSTADQVNLKRAVHCTLQSTTSQSATFSTKHKWWVKQKNGKIMQFIVEGKYDEESNKRVAGHMSHKTLVRKLDQRGYSRDEISAITGHYNKKCLDSYLDIMNEKKENRPSFLRLWVVFRGKLCRYKIQAAA